MTRRTGNKPGTHPAGTASNQKRRRWFRIGPGLLVAAAASFWVWRQSPPPLGSGQPPRIERIRVDSGEPVTGAATLLSAPDPDWLMAQQSLLGLSERQSSRLRTLHARWQRDTRDLRQALADAAVRFERETAAVAAGDRGGSTGGVTIKSLQEKARPISELSRQLADTRRAWWDEAADVLTLDQRRRVEQSWALRFARSSTPQQQESDR